MGISAQQMVERKAEFEKGWHWCSRGKHYLPVKCFGVDPASTFGLRCWCKACRKEYRQENKASIVAQQHNHYVNNRDRVLATNRLWRQANKERIRNQAHQQLAARKAKCVELAGGACQRCGYDEFNTGLSFHHVEPNEKDSTPTAIIKGGKFVEIERELDKCVLLCRNCHQALHGGEWAAEFIKREELGWTL